MIYMNKYALINNQNIVENIVLWDGGDSWQPPSNLTCLNVENILCSIGWTYDGSVFTAPDETIEPPAFQVNTKFFDGQ